MYCQKCGENNIAEARFCRNCGAPLGPAVQPGIKPNPSKANERKPEKKKWLVFLLAAAVIIILVLLLITANNGSNSYSPSENNSTSGGQRSTVADTVAMDSTASAF